MTQQPPTQAQTIDIAGPLMAGTTSQQKADLLGTTLKELTPEDRQLVARVALQGLTTMQKQVAVQQAGGLEPPAPGVSNIIWLLVITAFVLILLATSGSLIYGVIVLQRNADAVQVIVTIFTAAVGFLGGLLTPNPTRNTQSST
jgi:hypothetical protein